MEYSEPQWNSTAAVNLRATTFVLGDLNFTLPDSRILPGLESSITLFTRPERRSVSSTMTESCSSRFSLLSPVRSRTVSA